MTEASIRKTAHYKLGARPPSPRDLALILPPRLCPAGAERFAPAPTVTVQAPQSALGLHPCIALSSAAARTRLKDQRSINKAVVVVDREK